MNELVKKLDGFIGKYYLNQALRGFIYFLTLALGLFILVNTVEYFFYLGTGLRKLLFYSFIGACFGGFTVWVAAPLARRFSLLSRMSREDAALLIGSHFPKVKDKLLNLLQLGSVLDDRSRDLVMASIDQRTQELRPIPFLTAIDLRLNRKYLKYLAVPMLALIFILIAAPNLIPEASFRLIKNDVYFEPDMPFTFVFREEKLQVIEGENFQLDLLVEKQTALPEEVFVIVDGYKYKMQKGAPDAFSYTLTQVKGDLSFYFEAEGYKSQEYLLDVLLKPSLKSFELSLDYPSHTSLQDEVKKNVGDIQIPEGTVLKWQVNTANTKELQFISNDTVIPFTRLSEGVFSHKKVGSESINYAIVSIGNEAELTDTVRYSISVSKDLYPEISVDQYEDSLNNKYLYFLGEVSDDYGIKNLQFIYTLERSDSGQKPARPVIDYLPVAGGSIFDQFNHFFDATSLGLRPGDRLSYYFQVCDNDGINGSKCTKSKLMVYQMPTVDEFEAKNEQSTAEIKEKLQGTIERSQQLQEEVNALKERMLEKKNLEWEDKQAIEKVLSEQKKLEQDVQSIQNQMQQNFSEQKEYKEPNPDLIKKQEQLQELFDSVFDEEMKELMEKFEQMLDDAMKEQMMEELEEMEMSDEEVEKELDRMLELFKNLEFQDKLESMKNEMEELAKKQEELSEESKEGGDPEEITEKQEELNKEFEELAEKMEELEKLNEELSKPQDGFDDLQEKKDDVQSEQQEASDQLQKGNQKKAGDSQKSASDKMKEMAQQMSSMLSNMQSAQHAEDMDALKQLLENLVTLSFEQENLIYEFQKTDFNSPKYVSLVQEQFKIRDDSKLVEDSLYALAGRVFEIESFVTEQITDINREMEKTIDYLEERKTGQAAVSQQFVMTGYNNLALMLSEVLDQMQQSAASSMSGSQNCQNPGQKKGPGDQLGNLGQLQKQLNDQMNQLSEMMKSGKMPGGKGGMAKQFAEMAAKQAAIRDALRQLNEGQNSDGTNSLGELEKLMEEMDKTETDLVNKQLTEEMLKRQQEITVKLLEAAEAEKQREKDNKRESNTAQQFTREFPPSLDEYLKSRDAEIELYRTVPADLKPYYKGLVEKYFKSISFSDR